MDLSSIHDVTMKKVLVCLLSRSWVVMTKSKPQSWQHLVNAHNKVLAVKTKCLKLVLIVTEIDIWYNEIVMGI